MFFLILFLIFVMVLLALDDHFKFNDDDALSNTIRALLLILSIGSFIMFPVSGVIHIDKEEVILTVEDKLIRKDKIIILLENEEHFVSERVFWLKEDKVKRKKYRLLFEWPFDIPKTIKYERVEK